MDASDTLVMTIIGILRKYKYGSEFVEPRHALGDLREFQIPKLVLQIQSGCDSNISMGATRMLQKVEGCNGSKTIDGSRNP